MRYLWIGFDPRETAAFVVSRRTAERHTVLSDVEIRGLPSLSDLRDMGLYSRPTELRPSVADRDVLWDVISDAPMSTEFAISRFLVPELARRELRDPSPHRWAMFTDGDVLFRSDLGPLFDSLEPDRAVYCVKHDHAPSDTTKMRGQVQTRYARKNWSSVMIFNCDHAANAALTVELVNTLPGRDLHRFCWLDDSEIGALPPEWNHLVGTGVEMPEARIAHFTLGTPDVRGRENCEHAEEWRAELRSWAR